eukprot:925596-Alexandrium_andersonii.AAC.1
MRQVAAPAFGGSVVAIGVVACCSPSTGWTAVLAAWSGPAAMVWAAISIVAAPDEAPLLQLAGLRNPFPA